MKRFFIYKNVVKIKNVKKRKKRDKNKKRKKKFVVNITHDCYSQNNNVRMATP